MFIMGTSMGCNWPGGPTCQGRPTNQLLPCVPHEGSRRCWGRWEYGPGGTPPKVGRPTYHLDDSGSHWPSRRSLGWWEARPGGMTQLVGRPTDLCGPWPTTGLLVVSPLVIWSVVQSWVWLHTCLLPCGPKDPCAKCLNRWGQAHLDPMVGLTPWSMTWLIPWRGAPGGPKPWLADRGYGAHRAHFLLPCIEQAKSTSGTLLVINMFMWCLSSVTTLMLRLLKLDHVIISIA